MLRFIIWFILGIIHFSELVWTLHKLLNIHFILTYIEVSSLNLMHLTWCFALFQFKFISNMRILLCVVFEPSFQIINWIIYYCICFLFRNFILFRFLWSAWSISINRKRTWNIRSILLFKRKRAWNVGSIF